MRLLPAALGFALIAALPAAFIATAQEAVEASVSAPSRALIGERIIVTIDVRTGPNARVDIDPTAGSWGGLEVLDVSIVPPGAQGDRLRHRITVTAVSFMLGPIDVRPVLLVTTDGVVARTDAPTVPLEIAASLPPDAPLELVSLPAPTHVVADSQSWVTPVVAAFGLLGVSAAVALLMALLRPLRRRTPRQRLPVEAPVSPVFPMLPDEAEALADPVAAYRAMGLAIRRVLTDRHHLPAIALATGELGPRMEAAGVDRWQARLVRGLLENCDAVVYAGYRPAPDRRLADLNIAREIVEADA